MFLCYLNMSKERFLLTKAKLNQSKNESEWCVSFFSSDQCPVVWRLIASYVSLGMNGSERCLLIGKLFSTYYMRNVQLFLKLSTTLIYDIQPSSSSTWVPTCWSSLWSQLMTTFIIYIHQLSNIFSFVSFSAIVLSGTLL